MAQHNWTQVHFTFGYTIDISLLFAKSADFVFIWFDFEISSKNNVGNT